MNETRRCAQTPVGPRETLSDRERATALRRVLIFCAEAEAWAAAPSRDSSLNLDVG